MGKSSIIRAADLFCGAGGASRGLVKACQRLGRKLQWDPDKERFVGDKEADGWLAREMRRPWTYEAV